LNGDIFLPTDGFNIQRSDGTNWSGWGPVFPLTDPTLQSLAWVNQGGASVDTSRGSLILTAPAASGLNQRIYKRSAPSTPYTLTVGFMLTWGIISGDPQAGLCFRESGSGKLHTWHIQNDGTVDYAISQKQNSPTSWSANYSTLTGFQRCGAGRGPIIWLKIQDNGTNRICSYSADGVNWIDFHSVGRTDFITADEIGIFAGSAQTTYPTIMNVVSMKVS